jgi:hypothetical protein
MYVYPISYMICLILYPTAFLIQEFQVDKVIWLLKHKLRPENAWAIDPDYYRKLEAAKSRPPKALGCRLAATYHQRLNAKLIDRA